MLPAGNRLARRADICDNVKHWAVTTPENAGTAAEMRTTGSGGSAGQNPETPESGRKTQKRSGTGIPPGISRSYGRNGTGI